MARRNFHKRMLIMPLPQTQSELHRMVLDALQEITPAQIQGAIASNRSYLRRYLN